MNGVQASSPVSKRTSINELLNPIGRDAAATPVSKHETLPSMSSVVSLPSFPSMITVPVHYFPNGGPPPMYIPVQHHHQTMQHPGQRLQHLSQAPAPEPHHAQQTSTSSFSLRRAEWSGSTAPRRAANNDRETPGHASPASYGSGPPASARHGYPVAAMGTMSMHNHDHDHNHNHAGSESMDRSGTGAYYGNHIPQSPHDMPFDGQLVDYQSSERMSVRLAARSTRPPDDPGQSYYVQYPALQHPGGASFIFHPEPQKRKRAQNSAEFDDDGSGATSPASTSGDTVPMAKKARGKPRASPAKPNGTPTSSKRGYPAKKRNEAAQIVANAKMMQSISYAHIGGQGQFKNIGTLCTVPQSVSTLVDQTGQHEPIPELQFARCMSNRYRNDPFPRCVSCTRRWAGDTCRFQGIRFLLRDSQQTFVGVTFVDGQKADTPNMALPAKWNIKLERHHIDRTMKTVARALLPHLLREQIHILNPEVIRRPRETDVRATCDTCMTSLFSNSWMCRQCGREACAECFAIVKDMTGDISHVPTVDLPAVQAKREHHGQANPFFLSCTKRIDHSAANFSPVSRFCAQELDEAVVEMKKILDMPEDMENEEAEGTNSANGSHNSALKMEALPHLPDSPTNVLRQQNDKLHREYRALEKWLNDTKDAKLPEPNVDIGSQVVNPMMPGCKPGTQPGADIPTHTIQYFDDEELTEEFFRPYWALGCPVVVTGLLRKLRVQWTPEYFIEKYNNQSCLILECQTDQSQRMTVGEFFQMFGKYEGRKEHWKLKDWPPSADFKTTFPELFEDFMSVVPIPNYTRRDGALNIASHFPSNTVAPDLGPKMYNAFASYDGPDSKGTTRLHMDMADAVNIMVYSSKTPDDKPGCAAWDIFRAQDSQLIRKFLKTHFKGLYANDPIHSQQFYLDSSLRKKMYEEHGVKSFRIYQRPGEAVFIPAGCAHQVCNLADCIKVACDFVSPENIQRCETLTQEFRDQNQSHIWKEDVLQLRSMMWFAWLSCRQQRERMNETENGINGFHAHENENGRRSVSLVRE